MNRASPDPRINWTVEYMRHHLSEPLTVETFAGSVNLSRSRFTSLFTAQTGVSPMRYLQRLRLRRARLLLERSFLTVKEIMALVGYSDPSHFSRDFRREHRRAPSDFRGADVATPLKSPVSPSDNPPRKRRIGPPRARDPGRMYA